MPHAIELATVGSVHGSGEHVNDDGDFTPSRQLMLGVVVLYPGWHAGVHDVFDAMVVASPHSAEKGTDGSVHGWGSQEKASGGVKTVARHVALSTPLFTYPVEHTGRQVVPLTHVRPVPHSTEFATTGSVHGSAEHTNVAGDSVPFRHDDGAALTLYPGMHWLSHVVRDGIIDPSPHAAELETFFSWHAASSHVNPPGGVYVPLVHASTTPAGTTE